jgi:RecB family exonuclease
MPDKYTATWVSHSSMGDFLKCPRLYYLHNVYKDPNTGRKMTLVTPYMSLGIAVHNVVEGLGDYPSEERMSRDLRAWFNEEWDKVSGKKGGFVDEEQEAALRGRGIDMIETVIKNPRFLVNKRIKLPRGEMPCNFYLSEEDNIILNGLVDWIEYLPDDTLHIIDFKTGKHEEKESSLQMPIYLLLCHALQKRKVTKASYWYLDGDTVIEKTLPSYEEAYNAVYAVAKRVKEARDKKEFPCSNGEKGCIHCSLYEEMLLSKKDRSAVVEYIGVGGFNQDIFIEKQKREKANIPPVQK